MCLILENNNQKLGKGNQSEDEEVEVILTT